MSSPDEDLEDTVTKILQNEINKRKKVKKNRGIFRIYFHKIY